MSKVNIVAFCGSLRKASYNMQALNVVAKRIADSGGNIKIINLNDYEIPIYNQDIEDAGTPPKTEQFKLELYNADAILMASPEYNGSYSAALKNAIDWATRKLISGTSTLPSAFSGKVVGMISVSPGKLGGLRGLRALRELMYDLGAIVAPGSPAIPFAHEMTAEKLKALEDFADSYLMFCQRNK